jgi:exopolysaccharide biosynthesis polyprenyl glycosylphosphotransferase
MTQITVDISSSSAPLTTPIPRPRAPRLVAPAALLVPTAPVAAPMASPAALDAVLPSSTRTSGSALALALDAVLALTFATLAAALDRLPLGVATAAALAWPVLLLACGHYRRGALGESRLTRTGLVLGTGLRATVLTLAVSPWLTGLDPFALAELVAAFSVAGGVHQLVGVRRRRVRLVLAGRPRDVREAMRELQAADSHELVAVCLTRTSREPIVDLPTYIGFADSPDVAHRHQADAFVLLPGARLTAAEVRRLHWALAGVGTELCVGTGLVDVTPDRTRVFASGGLNLVHVAPAALRGPRRLLKDVLERAAATLGLALLLPLLLVLAAIVRLDTPGPALYRQQRVGKDGRLFTMFKFRSMSQAADAARDDLLDANEADGVLFKIQHDPRITRTGRWLRRWSLDEVPQLWNVVRGDMSLVGPRPALPEEVARYDVDPTRRLVVKPGLTGLWQVSGRSDLSWSEAVRLDVRYVDNWSMRLDAQILVRTFRAVLGHRGAY